MRIPFLNRFKKILIVEDDPSLGKALVEKFSRAGYQVIHCTDGADVARTVVADKPHGVVLDLMLPHKDGMSILEILRGPDINIKIPVIILTNLMGKTHLREDAENLNALYFDKSSTDIKEVLDAMERLL